MGSSASSRPATPRSVTPTSRDIHSNAQDGSPHKNSKQQDNMRKQSQGAANKPSQGAASKARKPSQENTGLSLEPRDVMISYSHSDKDAMLKIKERLEQSGITVWVDVVGLKAGVDFLSKIGQAIIDAKMMISLLSEKTIQSKYCQDELALGYVSSKKIFPVNMKASSYLFPKMDTGMKLQLARFKWYSIEEDTDFDKTMSEMIRDMKEYLASLSDQNNDDQTDQVEKKKKPFKRQMTARELARQASQFSRSASVNSVEAVPEEEMNTFWERHFGESQQVEFFSFQEAFNQEYGGVIKEMFAATELEWVESILRRELFLDECDEAVTKLNYDKFCTQDGEFVPFWYCLQEQFIQSYTIKEVFDMESSVRVEAIQNLGKFHSPAVVEALTDLLTDKDNNARAVAAISLAKTGTNTKDVVKKLLKCLDDKDRLVRESGCLALGHLKAEEAVPKIVNLWRNDFISSVREAAQVALEQIGGEEANKAMQMTRVLAEEIHMLTKEK